MKIVKALIVVWSAIKSTYEKQNIFFRVISNPLEKDSVSPCPSDYDNLIPAEDLKKVEELLTSLIFPYSNNNEEIEKLLYSFVLPDEHNKDYFSSGKMSLFNCSA